MRSRRLNRRIEVWASGSQSNGFGGKTPTEQLQFETWAEVKTLGGRSTRRLNDLGLNDLQNIVEVTLRRRSDFNYNANNVFFKFKTERYHIRHIEDQDVEKRFIKAYCHKELTKQTVDLADGGQTGFPYTFD